MERLTKQRITAVSVDNLFPVAVFTFRTNGTADKATDQGRGAALAE
jgi:hypothetical protein